MKIEAGKFYKTRSGHKAFVAGVSPFASTQPLYRMTGFVDGGQSGTSWNIEGEFAADGMRSPEDLVAEWIDPPTPLEALKAIVTHMDGWAVRSDVGDLLVKAREAIAAAEATSN